MGSAMTGGVAGKLPGYRNVNGTSCVVTGIGLAMTKGKFRACSPELTPMEQARP
jgi:hypothetical protein